jgi:hypothetical protein
MELRTDRLAVGGWSEGGRLVGGPRRFGEKRFMRLLGLSTTSVDPVTIITAAQVRLRRWRRQVDGDPCPSPHVSVHIRQITEARDTLLRLAIPREVDAAAVTRE